MSQPGYKNDFFDGQLPEQNGKKPAFLDKYGEQRYLPQVRVPIEYTAVIAIVMLVAIIVAYAIGVERGKVVALVEAARKPLSNDAADAENEPVIDIDMVEKQAQELMKKAENPEPPPALPVQAVLADAPKPAKDNSGKMISGDNAAVKPALPAKIAAGEAKTQQSVLNTAGMVRGQGAAAVPEQAPAAEKVIYTLQLASSKNEEYAKLELDKMKSKGIEASMTKKGDWFKIYTAYPSFEEAEKAKKKLSGDYKDCLIVKTKQ